MQKKLTKAQKAKRREYQRTWWLKNKSKAAKSIVPANAAPNIDILPVINAFYVLNASTTDKQVKEQLSKILGIIILENSKN